jgi:hypothetical protein
MAAKDPRQTLERAAERPIFLHGADEIIAARRLEAALAPHERAERPLVNPDHRDQQQSRRGFHQRPAFREPRHRTSFADRAAACFASRTNASLSQPKSGSTRPRGIATKSSPIGKSVRRIRKASRNNRFQRFRATAPPTRDETDKPIRLNGNPFSQQHTVILPSDADRRRA